MLCEVPAVAFVGSLAAVVVCLALSSPDVYGAASSPEDRYNRAVANADRYAQDGAGETFCWHANASMGSFVGAYRASGDTSWLDWGVKYYEYAVAKMSTGPDGYRGWVGPYGYQSDKWCDVHVGDALLMEHVLNFAELVLSDEKLRSTYGETARRYVDMAKRDLIEKWDSRGTWREDGPYGAYTSWDTYCQPWHVEEWKQEPEVEESNLTLPFNKQNHMALACLKIYRITGEEAYREKAQKIFAYMKSRFQYFDDHYVWNYWEPFGPWDVDVAHGTTRHWVNVHPYRDYQAGEINQIIEAYHTGVVFDQQDIQRIINTNLEVMWNKDMENPQFRNSNATQPGREEAARRLAAEAEQAEQGSMESRLAGTLWTGLLDFSQTVRDIAAARRASRGGRAGGRAAEFDEPPSFKRRHADLPVTVFDIPLSECRSITAAAVMPQAVSKAKRAVIFCKAVVPVELEVAVYNPDGTKKLLTLFHGEVKGGTDGMEGFHVMQWDGSRPDGAERLAGDFRVRWTVPDGYREFPVTVTQ